MKITRTKKAIATGAATLGVLLGAAGITAAATNPGSANQSSVETDQAQEPSYQSSITAPDNATLDGLATITPEQAATAAVNANGGTAGKVELENENGNVVYGIEVTQPDGTKLDVKVDAGNGTVLAREADDATEAGDHAKDGETHDAETNDGAEHTSSDPADGAQ